MLTKRLGDIEQTTQAAESSEITAIPDATEVQEHQVEGEDEDTMMAGIQGEGTRMPLEEEGEEEEEEDETVMASTPKRIAVTESDIMESLLASEISE